MGVELLAVPNISEGRDAVAIEAIAAAFASTGAELLDVSSDPDHHRTVYTLRAPAGALAPAVLAGAREAIARIDLTRHEGVHPRVGAMDVAPIVFLDEEVRGAAMVEAIQTAELLAWKLDLPVYLYGELAGGRTRAQLRREHDFAPDYGPPTHPTAGATLVAARPPLVAFNVEIDATLEQAKDIASRMRELPGVVALGLSLPSMQAVQVSMNLEGATRPAAALAAVASEAPVARAELVAPARATLFADWPEDVELKGAHRAFL